MTVKSIEQYSNVITQNKGVITVNELTVGMNVLSYDTDSRQSVWKKVTSKNEVEPIKEHRIILKYSNNTLIKLSSYTQVLVVKPELQNSIFETAFNIEAKECNFGYRSNTIMSGGEFKLYLTESYPDLLSRKYYAIQVEDTNNFYCGNFGVVVVKGA